MPNSRIQDVASDASEAVADTLDQIAAEAANLSKRARRAIGEAGTKAAAFAEDFGEEAATRSRAAARVAIREARAHPVTTVAVTAACVGVVVGIILASRRR